MIKMPSWLIGALQNRLGRGSLAHALLITGPVGIGIELASQAAAQSLLCRQPQANLACGECQACHWFSQHSHPDYLRVAPQESQEGEDAAPARSKAPVISIDAVRAIPEFLSLTAHQGGRRAVLIEMAEAMTVPAQNALLKTLEEPALATVLLLSSSRPDRLLKTVLSRCQRLSFAKPSREEALRWLAEQGVDDAVRWLDAAFGRPFAAKAMAQDDAQNALLSAVQAELQKGHGCDALGLAARLERMPLEAVLDAMTLWGGDLLSLSLTRRPVSGASRRDVTGASAHKLLGWLDELARAKRRASHPLNARLLLEHLLLSYRSVFT